MLLQTRASRPHSCGQPFVLAAGLLCLRLYENV
jgi:hypothetical protein